MKQCNEVPEKPRPRQLRLITKAPVIKDVVKRRVRRRPSDDPPERIRQAERGTFDMRKTSKKPVAKKAIRKRSRSTDMKTTEDLRNEVLAIVQDLGEGRITNPVARSRLKKAEALLKKCRNKLRQASCPRRDDELR